MVWAKAQDQKSQILIGCGQQTSSCGPHVKMLVLMCIYNGLGSRLRVTTLAKKSYNVHYIFHMGLRFALCKYMTNCNSILSVDEIFSEITAGKMCTFTL